MKIIDERALKSLVKIIEYDNEVCGGLSDCFESKREQNKLIKYMKQYMKIPDKYSFEIWDLIGLHGADVLSPEDRKHIEYLYAQGTDNIVEEAKKLRK